MANLFDKLDLFTDVALGALLGVEVAKNVKGKTSPAMEAGGRISKTLGSTAGTPKQQRQRVLAFVFQDCPEETYASLRKFQSERQAMSNSHGPRSEDEMFNALASLLEYNLVTALNDVPEKERPAAMRRAIEETAQFLEFVLHSEENLESFIRASQNDLMKQYFKKYGQVFKTKLGAAANRVREAAPRVIQKGRDVDHRLSEWTRDEVAYWENGGSPCEPLFLRVVMGITARRNTRRRLAQEDHKAFTERRRSHA